MSLSSVMYLAKQYTNGARILAEWLGDGCVSVDRGVAQMRADICLSCPLNKPGFNIPKSVLDAIQEHAEFKLKMGMKVDGEETLQTCKACRCFLPLKVWVTKDKLLKYASKEELEKYDPRCWVTNNAIE